MDLSEDVKSWIVGDETSVDESAGLLEVSGRVLLKHLLPAGSKWEQRRCCELLARLTVGQAASPEMAMQWQFKDLI